jgi:2-hydroxy-3-oxopropionate reductase
MKSDTNCSILLTGPPRFRIDLHDKDMGIAISAVRNAGVALPVAGLVPQ